MEDLLDQKPDLNPIPHSQRPLPAPPPSSSFRSSHHRRAHSELNFRIPDDLDLGSDPLDAPSASFDEIGSEDDLFSTYMDISKFGSRIEEGSNNNPAGDSDNAAFGGGDGCGGGDEEKGSKPRHRYSNSVDGSSMPKGEGVFGDIIEAKKAMAPEKLAELWALDPKRAKR